MSIDMDPHVKLVLHPNNSEPEEVVDAEMLVSQNNRGDRRYTLKAVITGINFEEEIYAKTQDFSSGGLHRRIANFRAPRTPGFYQVTAYLLSEDGKEKASSVGNLIVRLST